MIKKKTWDSFRASGLLWFVNTILHVFGWTIVVDVDKNEGYPARTKYRGFPEKVNDNGYRHITNYMANNIEELWKEVYK